MGRKSKFSFEVKMKAVLDYQQGKGSYAAIAEAIGAGENTVQTWIMVYQSQGENGLMETHHNRHWSTDIKMAAVQDYISGQVSLSTICKKYKISHDSLLRSWIMVYNDSHSEFKSTGNGRSKSMTKGRKVTFDEKIDIVKYCIAHNKNYYDTMDKFNVSYNQIYS